jgi:flagellin
LNGTYDFQVTNQAATVQDYQINAAKLPHNGTQNVQVVVTASAHHGGLFLSAGGASLNLSAPTARFIFDLAGSKGSRQFSFASSTTLIAVASAVNTYKDVTGVSAVASGNYVELKSVDFGSSNFVSFKVDNVGGQAGAVFTTSTTNEAVQSTASAKTFASINGSNAIQGNGVDVGAIINGVAATSSGNVARINTDFLDLSVNLTGAGAQALTTINAFTINSGGARFNLGPNVDITNQVSVGIKNVATRNLGAVNTGYLSSLGSGAANNVVSGNLAHAQTIVSTAIDQISSMRGRLGEIGRAHV